MLDPDFHITSPRLQLWYLNPSNDAHMSMYAALQNSPEILAVRALSGTPAPSKPITVADARASLVKRTEKLAKTGCGRYIISLRDDNNTSPTTSQDTEEKEFIGYVSMQWQRYPDLPCPKIPDLGFSLLAKYYGKGYANEACEALMGYFRETKGQERFAGYTHPDNVSSQKLFKRLGFVYRGIVDVAGVVGDGTPIRSAVWVKGVGDETDLEELGIGPGR
ncbi:hypothetical protein E8E13_005941 [Curvularia kusanoi]|uniref:N-acetyltransferase domain-containing protein n=1 Tax=Curvularia kusanoi TaxID=90978 RepID=A0A9P4TPL0_CURKU|nr:hypothetical protein E8E13_005941 [Curvularia kusanoi]